MLWYLYIRDELQSAHTDEQDALAAFRRLLVNRPGSQPRLVKRVPHLHEGWLR